MSKEAKLNIKQFLGLRYDDAGDTNLAVGEFSQMQNFKIISNYKLQKRTGYTALLETDLETPIQGQWYGVLDETQTHVIATGGKLYTVSEGVLTEIGELTDAVTSFFFFDNALYILNGHEFLKYDGTSDAESFEGYIPTVYVSGEPDGTNAMAYEPINLLNGKRIQTFNGDVSSVLYKLAETGNTAILEVLVNGVATTAYTANATYDQITFTSAPGEGLDNVSIKYTHDTGYADDVTKYTNARLYGGKNDNRVFLFGSGNRIIFSDLANGMPSAEYFPVYNTMDVGSSQYAVTGLSVQYDRMLIHKERGTWWTQYDYDTELLTANFPVYPLNDNVGSSYIATEQIIENNPFVIFNKHIYQFVASNVRDERNATYMSQRIQPLLDQLDFASVLTYDNEDDGEYWIVLGNKAYIYSYRLDVWFYYYFAHTITSIRLVDGKITVGTSTGNLMAFDDALTDNGTLINSFVETGWIDYGVSNIRKFLNFMWVQIYPLYDTSAEIYVQVDRGEPTLIREIGYRNMNFADVDFSDFSFLTNYNPQGFRLKPKAKKFVFIKISIVNNKDNRVILLGLTAPALLGGQSK